MRTLSVALPSFLALATVVACSSDTPTATDPAAADGAAIERARVSHSVRPDSILPHPDSLAVGDSVLFRQKLTDGRRHWIGQHSVWKVSDSTIATVRNWGSGNLRTGSSATITGKHVGSVTVTVTTQFGTSLSRTLRVFGGSPVRTPPGNGTALEPGTDIQKAVNAKPAGTTFVLRPGVFRNQIIAPKSGDTFIGAPGAILSGGRILTGWSASGRHWRVGGQTQRGESFTGVCAADYPGCRYPEDLFVDNVMLKHVTSLAAVGTGSWFFDYGARTIYIGQNPNGHLVETSVTPYAFTGHASHVTIRNLIIEKYAGVSYYGAINAGNGANWVVDGNELRLNHSSAIKMGPAMQVTNNKLHHNGLMGIDAWNVPNTLVEGNDIGFNNTAHYAATWAGGGAKFDHVQHVTARRNNVHDNYGPGLWTDDNAIYALFEYNTISNNAGPGITHEVSYDAVIRYNTVSGNGFGSKSPLAGGGIGISASPNTEVYGNAVVDNKDGITAREYPRGSGAFGPHIVKNVYAHDNIVNMRSGSTGVLQGTGSNAVYSHERNNRFSQNTYLLNGLSRPFYWMNAKQSTSEWKSYGQDSRAVYKP